MAIQELQYGASKNLHSQSDYNLITEKCKCLTFIINKLKTTSLNSRYNSSNTAKVLTAPDEPYNID